MTTSPATTPANRLFSLPRPDWLDLHQEETLDPARPIIDAHHHLSQKRDGFRYMVQDLAEDIAAGGHNVIATVYVECGAMYRARGPEAFRPVGEVEFANGVAAIGASGIFGPAAICAGKRVPNAHARTKTNTASFFIRSCWVLQSGGICR